MNNQTDIDLQEMIMNYEVIEMHYFVKHITSEGWLSAFSPQKPAFLKSLGLVSSGCKNTYVFLCEDA